MNLKMKLLSGIAAMASLVITMPLAAQQYMGNTQFLWNQMAINPAFAGSRQALETGVFYRNQWAGMEGAPTTENVFVHAPLGKRGLGGGLNFMRDRIGISQHVGVQGSLSYKLRFDQGTLAFGLSGEYGVQQYDWTRVDPYTAGDQAIPMADLAASQYNFGFGAFFLNEHFFAGFSVPRLLENSTRFNNNESAMEAIFTARRHIHFTAGGLIELSKQVDLQPVAMLRYVEGAPFQIDAGALFRINQVIWIGSTVRVGDAVSLIFDYDISKQLRVGYAYDYTLTRMQGHAGTHEFFLGYALRKKRDGYNHPRFF